jgi:hypothetical protein
MVLSPIRTIAPGMRCWSHKLLQPEIRPPHSGTAHVVRSFIGIVVSSFRARFVRRIFSGARTTARLITTFEIGQHNGIAGASRKTSHMA